MKKSSKIACIIAGTCIVTGAVITGAGLALGGSLSNGFSIRGNLFNIDSWRSHDQSRSTNEEQKIEIEKFKSIEIDIARGDIEIIQGNHYGLLVENVPDDEYTIEQENDVLTIKDNAKHQFDFGFIDYDDDYKYTIIVPAALKEVTIYSDFGDVFMEGIEAEDIFVDQSMGKVEFENMNVSKLLKVEQSMGEIEFDGKCAGDMDFSNSMGDTDINITGKEEDYEYKLSTSMGEIEVNGKTHGDGMDASYASNKGSHRITLNNSMGDISLEFR